MSEQQDCYNINDVATKLGVSHWTIRAWINRGKLPFLKIGRRVLIPRKELQDLVNKSIRPAKQQEEP